MLDETMTVRDIQQLADRVGARGTTRSIVDQVTQLEADAWLLVRVVRALLRHVNPSDTFNVHGKEGER